MNKIAKRFAALVAAGCLAAGSALAEVPSIDDVINMSQDERDNLQLMISLANYYNNYSLPENNEPVYRRFDEVDRMTPMYAGDYSTWSFTKEESEENIALEYLGAIRGSTDLEAEGVSSYYLGSTPNMIIFKFHVSYLNTDANQSREFKYYDFDVFTIDGKGGEKASNMVNLDTKVELYSGSNGIFYAVIREPEEEEYMLRYRLDYSHYLWFTSVDAKAEIK